MPVSAIAVSPLGKQNKNRTHSFWDTPAATWLSIVVIHMRPQVNRKQSQSYKSKKMPFKFKFWSFSCQRYSYFHFNWTSHSWSKSSFFLSNAFKQLGVKTNPSLCLSLAWFSRLNFSETHWGRMMHICCVPTCSGSNEQKSVWNPDVLSNNQQPLNIFESYEQRHSMHHTWSDPPWSWMMRGKCFSSWYDEGLLMWSSSFDAHAAPD